MPTRPGDLLMAVHAEMIRHHLLSLSPTTELTERPQRILRRFLPRPENEDDGESLTVLRHAVMVDIIRSVVGAGGVHAPVPVQGAGLAQTIRVGKAPPPLAPMIPLP